jgi:acyl-CoA reductase-like NAD-dependent aldehyde dehydrogenase
MTSASSFFEPRETLPLLIGGERVLARSGATFPALNPATGATLALVPRCGAEDVDAAVAAAHAAQDGWWRTHPLERAKCLQDLAAGMERHADDLAMADVLDNGSPIREMRRDVAIAASQLRYFAGLSLQVRGQTIPAGDDRLNYTLRQPYGVVARVLPFNHPLMFSAGKIAAPLIAGNTVVIKPSEHTSLSTLRLADLFAEIFPPGVVNVLTGYGAEVGDPLVGHPLVRRIAFIGGSATGRAIQARAAATGVKTVTLELGGKNPLVVFPDADLDLAVGEAIRGMNFAWQGQSCGSTSRLLVQRDLHDDFVAELAERVGRMRQGMPEDPETETGALVNEAQLQKVLGAIEIGRGEGATVVTGGARLMDGGLDRGFFVPPTVFTGVDPDSRLAQEEIFGPVLAVSTFEDEQDAMRIANGVQYGLTASVFTRDLALAHRFARDVEAGYVWVNDVAKHVPGTPYGGFKDSGIGREEDVDEIESYTQVKNVHVRI